MWIYSSCTPGQLEASQIQLQGYTGAVMWHDSQGDKSRLGLLKVPYGSCTLYCTSVYCAIFMRSVPQSFYGN